MKFSILLLLLFATISNDYIGSSKKMVSNLNSDLIDIEKSDTFLLGKKIETAIAKLNIDSTQLFTLEEPPGVVFGIHIKLLDTCSINLFIKNTSIINEPSLSYRTNYKYILKEKIVGIAWKKPKSGKYNKVGAVREMFDVSK